MMTPQEKLTLINEIAKTKVVYSDHTNNFYVSSEIEIKEGSVLTSPCEHRKTVDEAIDAFYERLIGCRIIVGAYTPSRTEYKLEKDTLTKV